MAHRTSPTHAQSDLAVLVETEARLDREIARTRERAEAIVNAARIRTSLAGANLAAEIASDRERIAARIDHETEQRVREIEAEARAQIASLDAIRGEVAIAHARAVVEELVALVLAEVPR
jgi:hypothetical protein